METAGAGRPDRTMDERVRGYEDTLRVLASQFVGWNGAELDDLVQEGRIHVWHSLERGVTPSRAMIENRMKDWVRWVARQSPIPYEALLPLGDFAQEA